MYAYIKFKLFSKLILIKDIFSLLEKIQKKIGTQLITSFTASIGIQHNKLLRKKKCLKYTLKLILFFYEVSFY